MCFLPCLLFFLSSFLVSSRFRRLVRFWSLWWWKYGSQLDWVWGKLRKLDPSCNVRGWTCSKFNANFIILLRWRWSGIGNCKSRRKEKGLQGKEELFIRWYRLLSNPNRVSGCPVRFRIINITRHRHCTTTICTTKDIFFKEINDRLDYFFYPDIIFVHLLCRFQLFTSHWIILSKEPAANIRTTILYSMNFYNYSITWCSLLTYSIDWHDLFSYHTNVFTKYNNLNGWKRQMRGRLSFYFLLSFNHLHYKNIFLIESIN